MKIAELLAEVVQKNPSNLILECDTLVKRIYPDLNIRWARIYGNRWSYFHGQSNSLSLNSRRVQLGNDWGILLDNPETLTPEQERELITALKECFTYANNSNN